jgi:hypothetical protein
VRERIEGRERKLKALVARFAGCLSDLPERQRRLLELRTGVGASKPLGPHAAAEQLHVGSARFAQLEKQAIRELRGSARTRGCGGASEVVEGVMAFIGEGFGGAHSGASGGVEAVRYNAAPNGRARLPLPQSTGLLGAGVSSVASDLILILLLVFGAGLTVGAVVADAAGVGPRHEQWRERVINRIRAPRRPGE